MRAARDGGTSAPDVCECKEFTKVYSFNVEARTTKCAQASRCSLRVVSHVPELRLLQQAGVLLVLLIVRRGHQVLPPQHRAAPAALHVHLSGQPLSTDDQGKGLREARTIS